MVPFRPTAHGPITHAYPGAHPAVLRLARQISGILENELAAEIPARVAGVLAEVLAIDDLLAPAQQVGHPDHYSRHALYADPMGRFTILSLIWGPGQWTPIHGHTAWGATGVYRGTPTVAIYELSGRGTGVMECREIRRSVLQPGQTGFVRMGLKDIHRIGNDSNRDTAITIHAYGRDLIRDPDSLNIILPV